MSSPSRDPVDDHGGMPCANVHGETPPLFWAIDSRKNKEARAAIIVGLLLIVIGMGLAALVSNQVVAWMMVVPVPEDVTVTVHSPSPLVPPEQALVATAMASPVLVQL